MADANLFFVFSCTCLTLFPCSPSLCRCVWVLVCVWTGAVPAVGSLLEDCSWHGDGLMFRHLGRPGWFSVVLFKSIPSHICSFCSRHFWALVPLYVLYYSTSCLWHVKPALLVEMKLWVMEWDLRIWASITLDVLGDSTPVQKLILLRFLSRSPYEGESREEGSRWGNK